MSTASGWRREAEHPIRERRARARTGTNPRGLAVTADPTEMVARVLAQLPRDPRDLDAEDLAQLVAPQAALAAEAVEVHEAMRQLKRKLSRPDARAAATAVADAQEYARLQRRHGSLLIAGKRLDDYSASALAVLGFDPADLAAGD